MIFSFRNLLIALAIATGVATSYSVIAEERFDRLDGTGPSRKKVDVIEWEGNLEIHVYPKGSTAGLSAKLDDRTEGKKVMVIGYRFHNQKRLIRRAILGVPFDSKIKGFIDPTEKDFDKMAFSNQDLPAPWKAYPLDPAPAQWYPDGDERNEEVAPQYLGNAETPPTPGRAPASVPTTERKRPKPAKSGEDHDGSLNQYNW